ncbi:hypothetical protein BASH2_02017 [Bacillus anthracis]|nr:hypothetical protein BASH2_02017 [Bacillus anthracis]
MVNSQLFLHHIKNICSLKKVIEAMTVIVQVALSLGFLSPIFGEVLFLDPMDKRPLGHSV